MSTFRVRFKDSEWAWVDAQTSKKAALKYVEEHDQKTQHSFEGVVDAMVEVDRQGFFRISRRVAQRFMYGAQQTPDWGTDS